MNIRHCTYRLVISSPCLTSLLNYSLLCLLCAHWKMKSGGWKWRLSHVEIVWRLDPGLGREQGMGETHVLFTVLRFSDIYLGKFSLSHHVTKSRENCFSFVNRIFVGRESSILALIYWKFEHSLEINEIFPPFVNTNYLTTMHLGDMSRIIKLLANIFVKTKASSDWCVLLLQEENSKNGKVSVGSLKTRLCTASLSQTGNVTQKYSFMLTFPDDLFFLLSFPTTVFFFGSGYEEQKTK